MSVELEPKVSAGAQFDAGDPQASPLRVVVTRAEAQDGPLSSQLRSLGLAVLLWPAVRIGAAEMGALEAALRTVEQFDWIVFASRYAVAAVLERVSAAPTHLRVAAVGQATAQVLRQRGWPVHLVPDEANAAALISAFASMGMQRARVLYPASSRALPTIAAGLTQLGAQVTQVEAYRTQASPLDADQCRAWIARDAIDAVTFASPSAVIELAQALGEPDFAKLVANATVVCIGPTTAREVTRRGANAILAEAATLRGLALTTSRVLQVRN